MSDLNALLKDAIDVHVHVGPDVVRRHSWDSEAAAEAREAGMRGLIIKSHCAETASRAQIAAKSGGSEVYGCLALNRWTGGLNVFAVDSALRLGAKLVFMPTFHALHHIRHRGERLLYKGRQPQQEPGITVLDAEGRLVPEVADILSVIASYDATLATGHLSPEESALLVPAALAAGVKRIILTHVFSDLVRMSLDQVDALARSEGVFVEHCCIDLIAAFGAEALQPAEVAAAVRLVGPAKTILSSDGGNARLPLRPVEMLRHFGGLMLEHGFSVDDVRQMLCDSPARALGLGS